jgi:hypothetical protein
MKTIATILSLLALTACSSLDIDAARVGVGTSFLTAEAITDRADHDQQRVTVQVTNNAAPGVEVGLRGAFGTGYIGEVSMDSYEIGGVARRFFTNGAVRPYIEGRIGYRRAELYDDVVGAGSSDMLTWGAGLGLELQATHSLSVFAQADYDAAFGESFITYGPGATFGIAVRF